MATREQAIAFLAEIGEPVTRETEIPPLPVDRAELTRRVLTDWEETQVGNVTEFAPSAPVDNQKVLPKIPGVPDEDEEEDNKGMCWYEVETLEDAVGYILRRTERRWQRAWLYGGSPDAEANALRDLTELLYVHAHNRDQKLTAETRLADCLHPKFASVQFHQALWEQGYLCGMLTEERIGRVPVAYVGCSLILALIGGAIWLGIRGVIPPPLAVTLSIASLFIFYPLGLLSRTVWLHPNRTLGEMASSIVQANRELYNTMREAQVY